MRLCLLLVSLPPAILAGCTPREAYYRPAGRRALGRDGFVGARHRVPPEAVDDDAAAVAALGPVLRGGEDGTEARVSALLDFRNKRRGTVTFLPGSVSLEGGALGRFKPLVVVRNGGPVEGPVEIPHWHRACFEARFALPAEGALTEKAWTLRWEYRYAGRSYPQRTRFVAAGPELARRSLSGAPCALAAEAGYSHTSGVPFLMNVPFVGALFRSDVRSESRVVTEAPAGANTARGSWWPLEPE